jgi:hypothetical protein
VVGVSAQRMISALLYSAMRPKRTTLQHVAAQRDEGKGQTAAQLSRGQSSIPYAQCARPCSSHIVRLRRIPYLQVQVAAQRMAIPHSGAGGWVAEQVHATQWHAACAVAQLISLAKHAGGMFLFLSCTAPNSAVSR